MTGFGQASAESGDLRLTVELRGVNHRYVDFRLRVPPWLFAAEGQIRSRALAGIKRGRVEMNVAVEAIGSGAGTARLDRALAAEAVAMARALRDEFDVEGAIDVNTLLALPGVLRGGALDPEWGAEQRALLERTIDAARQAFDRERCREGQHLQRELSRLLAAMSEIASAIRARAALLPDLVRGRLTERLRALGQDLALDPARVAQEALILADRADVTEELVRLAGHLEQAQGLVDAPDGEPLGKRLEFLLQEIQRETNTVNSKSVDLDLSRLALALKAETEKVREQVQNLE